MVVTTLRCRIWYLSCRIQMVVTSLRCRIWYLSSRIKMSYRYKRVFISVTDILCILNTDPKSATNLIRNWCWESKKINQLSSGGGLPARHHQSSHLKGFRAVFMARCLRRPWKEMQTEVKKFSMRPTRGSFPAGNSLFKSTLYHILASLGAE